MMNSCILKSCCREGDKGTCPIIFEGRLLGKRERRFQRPKHFKDVRTMWAVDGVPNTAQEKVLIITTVKAFSWCEQIKWTWLKITIEIILISTMIITNYSIIFIINIMTIIEFSELWSNFFLVIWCPVPRFTRLYKI